MQEQNVYEQIAARTGGDIYLGIVGPVRSGKSTLIRRFAEVMILPHMKDAYEAERIRDELPQSGQGKTVMTAEPKFVPQNAAEITFGEGAVCRIRMADCVGYLIPGAEGTQENGEARMVHTPWNDEPIPFEKAAAEGTEHVIRDHATIGILVTTDGTIGEFPREAYREAEEKTASELSRAGKPFVVICNSATPESPESIAEAERIEAAYGAPTALLDCRTLTEEDVGKILEMALLEFPVRQITVGIPGWITALPEDDALRRTVTETIRKKAARITRLSDAAKVFGEQEDGEVPFRVLSVLPAQGMAAAEAEPDDSLFWQTVSEKTGLEIRSYEDVFRTLCELSEIRKRYRHLSDAIEEVEEKGYGIVMPEMGELKLEEPEIVRQGGGYGVRLRASAPSIHMIRAQIRAEVSPIVGTEQQTEEIVQFLLREFEEDPSGLWQTDLFGKSLHELINESLHAKLEHMPDEARRKLGDTIARIINEGSGGLICILL